MPQTINGVGTWYFGKESLRRREGVCEFCGNAGVLSSYDTRLFVVFLYIPIIPLGRKHIIDECPSCRRHRAMSQSDWQELCQKASSNAMGGFRENPDDKEKARECLHTFTGLLNKDGLKAFRPDLLKYHGNDAEMMTALAGAEFYLSELKEAEADYRAALQIDPEYLPAREGLAELLMREDRPREAVPMVAHIVDRGEPDKMWMLYQLALAWQRQGNHVEALRLFDQCQGLVPQLRNDKAYKKARKVSEKNRNTNKPVIPKERRKREQTLTQSGGGIAVGKLAFITGPIILLGLLGLWFGVAYHEGTSREVYFVSGLSEPYDVIVNGERLALHPGRPNVGHFPEGMLKIEPAQDSIPIEPVHVTIETGFFGRPFKDPVFVVNPDQTAIVEWETTYYVPEDSTKEPPDGEFEGLTNLPIHTFKKANYVFEEFPESLTLEGSGFKKRSRVGVVHSGKPWSAGAYFPYAMYFTEPEDLAHAMIRRYSLEPEKSELLYPLAFVEDSSVYIDELESLLDREPLLVDAHRVWQDAMIEEGRRDEALAHYREHLGNSPDDDNLKYLLARIVIDPDESRQLLMEAASSNPPSAYALYALGYADYANGRFNEAANNMKAAVQLKPDHQQMTAVLQQALLDAGRYDEALAMVRADRKHGDVLDDPAFYSEMQILYEKGEIQQADAMMRKYVAEIRKEIDEEAAADVAESLQLQKLVLTGRAAEVLAAPEGQYDLGQSEILRHLYNNDLDAALRVDTEDGLNISGHAMLAVAAMRAGQTDVAEGHKSSLIELLEIDSNDSILLADALRGEPQLSLDKIIRVSVLPTDKVPVLILLAETYPQHREIILNAARRMNVEKSLVRPLYDRYLS